MLRFAVVCVVVGITGVVAQPLVLDCGNPRVITTENPEAPYMPGGAPGGLDADYPGDEGTITLSKGEAGKTHYGSPDALLITVEVSGEARPLIIRIGYKAYQYGTSACEVTWDDEIVATLNCRAPDAKGEAKVAQVKLTLEQSEPGRHVLKLTENSGLNGQYANIDAVVFEGDPQLALITPKGKRWQPRAPHPRKTESVDTSAAFYRERDGAPVREVFDDACLSRLAARWNLSGSAGGVLCFRDRAIYVPTPPDEVHQMTSPARGDSGTFYISRKAQLPTEGVIRLRLKSVFTGDGSVSLASFCAADGKDKRYFCRFREHLALSDGKFVHNIIPIDDEFHDLKIIYEGDRAQVLCDGEAALADETWPAVEEVCIGHAMAAKGYGIGVAVESFFAYPRPEENPIVIKVVQDGEPVAGARVRVGIAGRETEAQTDENGSAEFALREDVDYPQALEVSVVGGGVSARNNAAFPGDVWVVNQSPGPGAPGPTPRPASGPPSVNVELGRSEWRLDFGADGSPLARGFEAVGPNTRAAGKAFGWLDDYELDALDFPEADHPLAGDLVDVIRRGARVGFEVATPPGDYVVALICASPDIGPEFEVWCEGASAAVVRQPRWGTCETYAFPVSTADGALTMQFDVGVSPALAGMIITPADPDDPAGRRAGEFVRELQQRLIVVRAMAQGIMPEPPDPEPEPELTAEDRARGFVAFPHSYMRTVYASSRPHEGEVGAPATGFACAGEREPVLFSIWPLKDLRECRVAVGDLRSPEGGLIPSDHIRVQAVRIWPQRFGKNTFRSIPELIEDIPENGLELRANQARTVWLTVRIPEGQAPGDYRGQATISCDAGELRAPIWFKVLPIQRESLDDLVMGMYWSFGKSAGRDMQTARKQLIDMREHGCNSLTLHESVKVTQTEAGEEFDFTTLDALLQLYKELGFTAPIPYHGIGAYTNRDRYARLVTALVDEGKKRDWPELLFYPVDEPGNNPERLDLAEDLCKLIKTIPGARTYITTNGRGVDAARLDPWLDVRCYQHLSYNPEEARKTKQAGDTLWFYTGPPSSILITRMNEGIWWFRSEMTAHYYWHYCYPIGDPWYDFDGKGDYCATYPGEEGPVATIGWEGMREGLDDLRYFRTLRARVQQARNRGVAQALADRADEYLNGLCERIPADGADIKQARKAIPLEEFVAIRWQVAGLIMALDNALAGRESETLADDEEFSRLLIVEQ